MDDQKNWDDPSLDGRSRHQKMATSVRPDLENTQIFRSPLKHSDVVPKRGEADLFFFDRDEPYYLDFDVPQPARGHHPLSSSEVEMSDRYRRSATNDVFDSFSDMRNPASIDRFDRGPEEHHPSSYLWTVDSEASKQGGRDATSSYRSLNSQQRMRQMDELWRSRAIERPGDSALEHFGQRGFTEDSSPSNALRLQAESRAARSSLRSPSSLERSNSPQHFSEIPTSSSDFYPDEPRSALRKSRPIQHRTTSTVSDRAVSPKSEPSAPLIPVRGGRRRSAASLRSEETMSASDQQTERKLINSGLILMLGLVLSKLTGQYREILYGTVLQHRHLTDAYVRAFLIPDFIYDLLIGGSIQAALIPTLAATLGTRHERKTWRAVSIFISFISIVMLSLLLIGEIFTPWILAPIVGSEHLALTVKMARVLFPQTFWMMSAALSIGIVNAHKQFIKTSFGPSIYNLCVILSLYIFGAPNEAALIRVGVGITLGAFIYFVLQYTLGFRELRPFRFCLDLHDPEFKKLILLAVPTMISSSIAQFSTVVSHAFVKDMVAGSSTALRYATSIWLLPYGVFSVGIGQAMLPTLSEFMAKRRLHSAAVVLRQSMRQVLFLAIPSAIILFFMSYDVTYGIFIWGPSEPERLEVIRLAAGILSFYCFAIIFQSVIYIMNFAFYSIKKTTVPLLSGIIFLAIMCLVAWPATKTGLSIRGLSLAYALAGCAVSLFLYLYFKRLYPQVAPKRMKVFFVQELIASAALIVLMLIFKGLSLVVHPAGKLMSLAWLGIRGFLALAFYLYVCDQLYLPEVRRLLHLRPKLLPQKSNDRRN
ncbi:MAG: murein biosynthesis integral membrane protein MurJ [Eubacteriales bacterium]|nr:murein biosynthesis integral membrane protein MurJ [Eubacteriales bacterium]